MVTVPEGVQPDNQAGEVQRFELLAPEIVQAWAAREQFTPEAGLVWAGFWGW
ncbi:hypothetical protein D3C73_1614880 [compost metagenome]